MLEIKPKQNHKYGELTRELIRELRRAISAGEYTVGTKLPSNRELAEQMSVSQVTARMAVLQLAREGVLEVRKNRGTYVRNAPPGTIPEKQGKPSRIGVILSPWDTENTPAWDSKGSLDEEKSALRQRDLLPQMGLSRNRLPMLRSSGVRHII